MGKPVPYQNWVHDHIFQNHFISLLFLLINKYRLVTIAIILSKISKRRQNFKKFPRLLFVVIFSSFVPFFYGKTWNSILKPKPKGKETSIFLFLHKLSLWKFTGNIFTKNHLLLFLNFLFFLSSLFIFSVFFNFHKI